MLGRKLQAEQGNVLFELWRIDAETGEDVGSSDY